MDIIEAAKTYYRKFFSFDMLFRVIRPKTFRNREFGFTIIKNGKKIFRRNLSFNDPASLLNFIISENVIGVYVGATYSIHISPQQPINKKFWVGRELVFDLDLTDYDDVRRCGKGKEHYCKVCWPLVRNAALFIDETLREDFGFNEIIWVYSGRRGLHAWIKDEEAFILDEEIRESIADYINIKESSSFIPPQFKNRALKIYSKDKSVETLVKISKQKKLINKFINEVRKELPRIDKSVTIDMVRLLRMPGSIHDSTGKLVTIVNNLEKFYPDDVPTVYDIIKGQMSWNLSVKVNDKS